VIIQNEEALRVQCEDVSPDEVSALLSELDKELSLSAIKGIGLSAPQIGIPKRAAIIRIPNGPRVDLVNCRIVKAFDEKLFEGEGCLSFPNRFENTMRYREIMVVDNLVEPYRFIATGLGAVVTQHELNHLIGRLLPDVAIKKGT
jgi:peptide deformylase